MKATIRQGEGNCYDVHGRMVTEENCDMILCHGSVWHDKVGWHGHCWLEDGDKVIDVSNGNNFYDSKEKYYKLGKVKNVTRYTWREAAEQMLKTGHYGPWEEDDRNK